MVVMDLTQSGQEPEVERLRERIGELVRERQDLRTAGANRAWLERNRLQLARRHSELGRALIELHTAAPAT
jgi:hypothetical protein